MGSNKLTAGFRFEVSSPVMSVHPCRLKNAFHRYMLALKFGFINGVDDVN